MRSAARRAPLPPIDRLVSSVVCCNLLDTHWTRKGHQMGQAKRKAAMGQVGSTLGANRAPVGVSQTSTPANNMGGKETTAAGGEMHQSVLDRYRVNVSLPPAVHRALMSAASQLGTSASQVALQSILNGLPVLQAQIDAVGSLSGGADRVA